MNPSNPPMTEEDIIGTLAIRVDNLEKILREIQMLNAMGKTLKIDEAIKSALDE